MITSSSPDNFDRWLSEQALDREDPYAMDTLEMGVRVADCFEVHGSSDRSILEYIGYWVWVARMNALLR